jgi:hypothetical protein
MRHNPDRGIMREFMQHHPVNAELAKQFELNEAPGRLGHQVQD